MNKAVINIIVEEHNDQVETIEYLGGTVLLLLEGLTRAIKRLESEAPDDAKMQFRTMVLEMLNRNE